MLDRFQGFQQFQGLGSQRRSQFRPVRVRPLAAENSEPTLEHRPLGRLEHVEPLEH